MLYASLNISYFWVEQLPRRFCLSEKKMIKDRQFSVLDLATHSNAQSVRLSDP